MRSPIYRNLDRPFQVLGFNPFELILLSITLLSGGELAEAGGFSRFWAFLITLLGAISLHAFRRAMGEFFVRRLLRFLYLPSELVPKLFISGRRI